MKQPHANVLLSYVRKLVAPSARNLPDRELLERFLAKRDEDAFAALVDRHGPMVWRACLRLLHDTHTTEDAFQATFLVLARKARSIGNRELVAAWLYRVACRIATQMRRACIGEDARASVALNDASNPVEAACARELCAILDDELSGLPSRYREPFLLCYLEGKGRDEAARQLGLSVRTLHRRLDAARELLRGRLTRRGVTLSAGLAAAGLSQSPAATLLPATLAAATARAALALTSGSVDGAVGISASAVAAADSLAAGIAGFRSMLSLALLLGMTIAGTGLLAYQTANKKQPAPPAAWPATPAARQHTQLERPRVDRLGDPLPEGALLRLGTVRMRHVDTVRAMAFFPGDQALLSADWHGVILWDTATGKELRHFCDPLGRYFQSVAFSADGQTVVLTTSDGGVEVWDAARGKVLFHIVAGQFPNVCLSPDGKLLALEDDDARQRHTLRLWNILGQREALRLISEDESSHSFVFSSDGRMLVTRAADETVLIFWDTATGKEIRRIHAPPGCIGTMALSPDGKRIVVGVAEKRTFSLKGGSSSSIVYFFSSTVPLALARCKVFW